MRKVLITGGAGFVGRHLARHLHDVGDVEIDIVDDMSATTMTPTELDELRCFASVHTLDFCAYRGQASTDFTDIFHLASPVGSLGILCPDRDVGLAIVELATTAAELAVASGAKLMYVSSSELYHGPPSHLEAEPLAVLRTRGARAEYALGKLLGEVVIHNAAVRAGGLAYNIVRPFNLIGEHQSSALGFVVPRFFEAALRGDALTVFGDGTQERSFCDVHDFCEALVRIHDTEITGETINIGNPDNRTSIGALAEHVIDLVGRGHVVHVDPHSLYGPLYSEGHDKIADVTRLERLIGWRPRTTLAASLERLFSRYLANHAVGHRLHA